ncbi:MAG: hypothetical protein ACRDS0_24645 [Pseudonocardiaceae bacterium]
MACSSGVNASIVVRPHGHTDVLSAGTKRAHNYYRGLEVRTTLAWQRIADVNKIVSTFSRDSPQFQIAAEVTPLASEAVLDKNRG